MKWNIHSNYGAQQANNQKSKMKESDFLNLYNLWSTQKKKKKSFSCWHGEFILSKKRLKGPFIGRHVTDKRNCCSNCKYLYQKFCESSMKGD